MGAADCYWQRARRNRDNGHSRVVAYQRLYVLSPRCQYRPGLRRGHLLPATAPRGTSGTITLDLTAHTKGPGYILGPFVYLILNLSAKLQGYILSIIPRSRFQAAGR